MLTPEEAQAAVEQNGSQSAAARALGVPRNTFLHWLNPEAQRTRCRRYYDSYTGPQYARRLLQIRRTKGLARMAARNERSRSGSLPREVT